MIGESTARDDGKGRAALHRRRRAAAPTALRERIYVCPRCGGTLEIDCPAADRRRRAVPRLAQALGRARAASRDPRDISGVWRYREMLPFDEPLPFVTLFEGNTPLYRCPALRANTAGWSICG